MLNLENKNLKNKITARWLIGLLLVPVVCFSQVLNGSFETETEPSLDNWLIRCNDGESFQDAPDGGGSWCVRFLAGNLQGCFPRTAEQIVPGLDNGDIVETSVWVKQDVDKVSISSVYLKINNGVDKVTILSADTTTANEWTKLSLVDTLSLVQDDTVTIVLDSGTTSGPDILDHNSYFDLVEVKKIGTVIVSGAKSDELHPSIFRLFQNYPNPFNPETEIRFQLAVAGHVEVHVFNTAGQLISILIDRNYDAGYHSVVWDGKNLHGDDVSSGIYIYRIETGNVTDSKKMTLIR